MTEKSDLCADLHGSIGKAEQAGLDIILMSMSGKDFYTVYATKIGQSALREQSIAVSLNITDWKLRHLARKLEGIGIVVTEMQHHIRLLQFYGKQHFVQLSMRVGNDKQPHTVTLFLVITYIILYQIAEREAIKMETKFSSEQVKQVLASDEGKRLIAMLSKNGSLQAAAAAFKQGDMSAVQEALKPTLQTQEASTLLHKINGK